MNCLGSRDNLKISNGLRGTARRIEAARVSKSTIQQNERQSPDFAAFDDPLNFKSYMNLQYIGICACVALSGRLELKRLETRMKLHVQQYVKCITYHPRAKCRYFCQSAKVNNYRRFGEIPGPKGILGIGNFYNYFSFIGKYSWDEMHVSGLKKYEEYGPIIKERLFPGVDILHIYSPEDIATLLDDTKSRDYPQRRSHLALKKYRDDRPNIYRSPGLLPTNGPEWWRLRSEFQKGLSSPKYVRQFLPEVDAVTKNFIDALKKIETIDILPELSRLNLEILSLLVFDEKMNSFSEEEKQPLSRTSRLIEATNISNSCILPTDQSFIWRFYETETYEKFKMCQNFIEEIAVSLVHKKMQQLKEVPKMNGNVRARDSPLDEYFRNPNLNTADIVGMAVDLLLAGVDTTTFTTCFAIYHLCRNPESQNNLYAESCRVLPDSNAPITPEILNTKIPYTRAVLKESLRLNPISIGVGRILNSDTVFSGFLVPRGTVVVTQNMVACRLASNFKKPLEFVPERWLHREQKANPYLVLPFGHGMRACIARRLAEQNMLVFLLRLVRKYSIEWKGAKELSIKTYLINNPDLPINIEIQPRKH